ncbi:uncharacterized protein LOC107766942 [Nicotiana tabacum]|uniref:Uncharacterized protein LOC107766942 n=2 Tax=Nicotiana TaxID=4085 RepID=A0A1S3XMY8_TOBAC|nr:PREDICTED: uncharacterized protein LOC104213967 [Nicotiana sylvestris]XP_016441340.1 PREDICTED: uncharacterized protein LOC107766942 [Nicotiana tabacum]
MACLNMFNNDQQGLYSTMGPRISFSNDFLDTQQPHLRNENGYKEAPVSSDFEFSVPGYNMISADELFSKGKLLPLRENCRATTLKDELLIDDDDDYDDIFPRMGKGMRSWKQRLGLKRSQILPQKGDKNGGDLDRIDETKTPDFCNDMFANITGVN